MNKKDHKVASMAVRDTSGSSSSAANRATNNLDLAETSEYEDEYACLCYREESYDIHVCSRSDSILNDSCSSSIQEEEPNWSDDRHYEYHRFGGPADYM